MITLLQLADIAANQVKAEDAAADIMEGGAAGTAEKFKEYLAGQGLDLDNAKGTKIYDDACDTLRAAYRSQYCNRPRKGINMELARTVLDSTETQRAAWVDGSEEKRVWGKIQDFGRTKLQRVNLILWPKPPKADSEDAASESSKTKKAPSPDTILANLDAFLASNPPQALIDNLFDQFAKRKRAK
jgi:hypothetical protein